MEGAKQRQSLVPDLQFTLQPLAIADAKVARVRPACRQTNHLQHNLIQANLDKAGSGHQGRKTAAGVCVKGQRGNHTVYTGKHYWCCEKIAGGGK